MALLHTTIAVFVSLAVSAGAAAQSEPRPLPSRPIVVFATLPVGDLTVEQLRTLEQWTREYEDWAAWHGRWRNRPEPGWFSARGRRQPPAPPAWLPQACSDLIDDRGPLVAACRAFHNWLDGDDGAELARQQLAQARANREKPVKSTWWEHVHLDALWPMTQSEVSALGVFGSHATLHVTERFQVFLAPGVILMRLPSGNGGQKWNAATDWGFTYRLTDLRIPGMRRASTLHVNIARVWMFGVNNLPITGQLTLAGFSLTFKSR